jgi:hypothetical protein
VTVPFPLYTEQHHASSRTSGQSACGSRTRPDNDDSPRSWNLSPSETLSNVHPLAQTVASIAISTIVRPCCRAALRLSCRACIRPDVARASTLHEQHTTFGHRAPRPLPTRCTFRPPHHPATHAFLIRPLRVAAVFCLPWGCHAVVRLLERRGRESQEK